MTWQPALRRRGCSIGTAPIAERRAAGRLVLQAVIAIETIALLGTVGCATVPAPADSAPISGRIAINVTPPPAASGEPAAARSGTSLFELSGSADQGAITLSSPLGPTLARASWSTAGVSLVSSDGTRRFASLESLGQELLGEPLPLGVLFDWLRGRPASGWPAAALPGGAGFEQLGWRVDLGRFADGRIRLDRLGTVRAELRIVLDGAAP